MITVIDFVREKKCLRKPIIPFQSHSSYSLLRACNEGLIFEWPLPSLDPSFGEQSPPGYLYFRWYPGYHSSSITVSQLIVNL